MCFPNCRLELTGRKPPLLAMRVDMLELTGRKPPLLTVRSTKIEFALPMLDFCMPHGA